MTNGAQIIHRLARWSGLPASRAGEISFPAIARALAAGAPGLCELLAGDAIVGDVLDRYDERRHGMSAFPYQRYDIHHHKLRHP